MWSWNLNVELETNVELNVELESGANLTLVHFFDLVWTCLDFVNLTVALEK